MGLDGAFCVALFFAAVFFGLVVGLVALFVRLHGAVRRIDGLTTRLKQLERDLASLHDVAVAGGQRAEAPGTAPVAAPVTAPNTLSSVPADVASEHSVPRPDAPTHQAATSSPVPGTAPAPSPGAGIDWEQWLGIRGAALVGGIVIAASVFFLFRWSIETGLLSPTMRVVLGTIAGVACLAGSEWLSERYAATSRALGGAGIIALYASFWAARALYELVSLEVGFGLMALTTAACVALAHRRDAVGIAVMGVLGGFATPLLLQSGADRPIGLFGYVLLIDAGFLFVAIRRGWNVLAVLSLVGTVLLEALWVGVRMGDDKLPIALGVLGLFTVVFLVAGFQSRGAGRSWPVMRFVSVVMPFLFGIYFATTTRFGEDFVPLGVLMVFQCIAAGWVGRRSEEAAASWLLPAAVAGAGAVSFVAVLARMPTLEFAYAFAGTTVALTVVAHVFFELADADDRGSGARFGAPFAALGGVALLGVGLLRFEVPWPCLGGMALLAALALRAGARLKSTLPTLLAAPFVGVALVLMAAVNGETEAFPAVAVYFAVLAGFVVLFHGAALVSAAAGRALAMSSALLAAILSFGVALVPSFYVEDVTGIVVGVFVVAALGAFGATRAASGRALLGGMLAVAAGQAAQVWFRSEVDLPAPDATTPLLAALVGTVLFFVLWPFFAAPRLRAHRSTWYTAALAPLVGFVALYRPFEIAFPDAKGLLPIALGAVSVGALAAMRRVGPTAADVRRSATVWFAGVAIVFVSAAIPIQLEKQWITIGWAVEGMALLFLWRRLDHAGLKWVAFALLAATATRLVVNPYVLEYGDRGAHIVNWLLYTYWVPVVAMLFGMRALGSLEAERVRDRERLLYGKDGRPVLQVLLGAMAVALVFAWLNLTIADYFSPGRDIELSFERQPAKDLTTSISWGAYALMLLGLGVWRQSKGLRWTSLLLLVVTLLKLVFWDLSTLEGLYRVLSFLGLGVSLVIVSLVYQRFLSSKSVAARAAHEGEP